MKWFYSSYYKVDQSKAKNASKPKQKNVISPSLSLDLCERAVQPRHYAAHIMRVVRDAREWRCIGGEDVPGGRIECKMGHSVGSGRQGELCAGQEAVRGMGRQDAVQGARIDMEFVCPDAAHHVPVGIAVCGDGCGGVGRGRGCGV